MTGLFAATWRCSHDRTHRCVVSDERPDFCATYIGATIQCGARMTREEPSEQPAKSTTEAKTRQREGTMSKLIEMSSGAPDIADGNYIVTLTGIDGPRTVTSRDGDEFTLFDWTFATEEGVEITDSTSTKTGPKSKMRRWISALIGRVPAKDEGFDPVDLVGRQAVATIEANEDGWPKVTALGVLMTQPQPVQPAPQPVAAAPAVPVQPVVQAVPQPAAPVVQQAPELPLG